ICHEGAESALTQARARRSYRFVNAREVSANNKWKEPTTPSRQVGENMKNILSLMVVLCLFATTSFGQANNGTLTGTVADATGAVLPSVTITATNNATGVVSTI